MAGYCAVCEKGDVPPGQARCFAVKGVQVAVFNIDGRFFALRNECPHAGASLAHGYLEQDVIRCRIHHWGFRVCDGRNLESPDRSLDAVPIPLRLVGEAIELSVDAVAE
jgi:nitrite reductase/ring-hydroxylating ferredoxin subunit